LGLGTVGDMEAALTSCTEVRATLIHTAPILLGEPLFLMVGTSLSRKAVSAEARYN